MLECRALSPEWSESLADFFSALRIAGDEKWFHPHPLNAAEADRRTNYCGMDLYYVLVNGRQIFAYGMLRGWDEGYEIPSLGIAVHPSERGGGIGLMMMQFLHVAARQRGAKSIRIKVYKNNPKAIQLYESLGYKFHTNEGDQLVGIVDL
jgi:ribosomal-protein-alanine N-acetyltransferase